MNDIQKSMEEYLPELTGEAKAKLAAYFDILCDWNARMNLTAITEPAEVAKKHFADSLLGLSLLPQTEGLRLIDVGTGAGFPGLPLKIVRPDIQLTLLDSLNKRIGFLQQVCRELDIEAECIHARAEDGARSELLRANFGAATTRAVAGVSQLLEYTLPFLYKGGVSLMYKGPAKAASAELSQAKNALTLLKAEAKLTAFETSWGSRSIIVATKLEKTPKEYPRKAGTAAKNPL